MNIKSAVVIALGLVASSAALAAEPKFIDQRNMSEATNYEIQFCYRPSPDFFGVPGHAYVAFFEQEIGSSDISFRAFGATTKSITDIFGGDGYLNPEYASNIHQNCLVVQVNSGKYKSAWNIAKPLFSEPEYSYWNYHITANSCVDFASRIASELGLKTNNENVPKTFITQLKADNG